MNTYRKLSDGAWGATVAESDKKSGDTVTLTTRAGKQKSETLGDLVETTDNGSIFRLVPRVAKSTSIGSLDQIMVLFDKAKKHLKYPAIVMSVPAISETIRINVAGVRAKVPGSLNVVSYTAQDGNGRRLWYGRVTVDGNFNQTNGSPAIAERLAEFAADPAKVAADHGKLTGRCCFCNLPLSDERSTAVGYGATCASHYGLAWGDRPAEFAASAVA